MRPSRALRYATQFVKPTQEPSARSSAALESRKSSRVTEMVWPVAVLFVRESKASGAALKNGMSSTWRVAAEAIERPSTSHQAPSTKVQARTPKAFGAGRQASTSKGGDVSASLVLGIWRFSGAWCLVLGAFTSLQRLSVDRESARECVSRAGTSESDNHGLSAGGRVSGYREGGNHGALN